MDKLQIPDKYKERFVELVNKNLELVRLNKRYSNKMLYNMIIRWLNDKIKKDRIYSMGRELKFKEISVGLNESELRYGKLQIEKDKIYEQYTKNDSDYDKLNLFLESDGPKLKELCEKQKVETASKIKYQMDFRNLIKPLILIAVFFLISLILFPTVWLALLCGCLFVFVLSYVIMSPWLLTKRVEMLNKEISDTDKRCSIILNAKIEVIQQ